LIEYDGFGRFYGSGPTVELSGSGGASPTSLLTRTYATKTGQLIERAG
jgi:hypothetical protein